MIHTLPLNQRTLQGHFSRDLEPVLTITPGDSVRFAIPNSSWYLESGERFVPRDPAIGSAEALLQAFASKNELAELKAQSDRYGLRFDVRAAEELEVPAFTGPMPVRHAQVRGDYDGGDLRVR